MTAHRVSVEQMALLEPALSETVVLTCMVIMREAIDEAVRRGVPAEAARDFVLGHMNINIGILFGYSDARLSDGAKLAVERARDRLFKPDWRKVFDIENVIGEVKAITQGRAANIQVNPIMQLGISSYTYTWAIGVPGHVPAQPLTADGLLSKANNLGVHVVQVADNLPLDALSDSDLTKLDRLAGAQDIALEVGTRGIAPDHLRRYITLAERLRSPILRVVIDTPTHHPTVDEVVDTFRSLMPEFEHRNICLAIENHDRFTARTFADIVEQVASPCIGICLDTVNSFGALEGPAAVLDVLGPFVVNLHIKDFRSSERVT